MPSPFPGMDPYLESPVVWPGFHDKLVVQTVAVLQPQLRARGYFADSNERVWLTEPHRPVYPDNVILQHRQPVASSEAENADTTTALADEPVVIRLADVEIRESFVEIYDQASNQIVTGIEFISPTNKSDHEGRRRYQQKQEETRNAGIHLVEIDLIRRGPSVIDVSADMLDTLAPHDYIVHLGRRQSIDIELYPISLRERLPRIRLPLKTGDADATLDLQDVFNRCYEIGPYPERLDYRQPPGPPLQPNDEIWLDELLKTQGFRQ